MAKQTKVVSKKANAKTLAKAVKVASTAPKASTGKRVDGTKWVEMKYNGKVVKKFQKIENGKSVLDALYLDGDVVKVYSAKAISGLGKEFKSNSPKELRPYFYKTTKAVFENKVGTK